MCLLCLLWLGFLPPSSTMSQFSYSAVTREGRLTQGRLEALDQRTVTQRIQGMGLIPASIEEVVAKSERRRLYFQGITKKDILCFIVELATLNKTFFSPHKTLTMT